MNILVAMPTRDGRIAEEVRAAMLRACGEAHKAGYGVGVCFKRNKYGVAPCRNEIVAEAMTGGYTHVMFIDDDVKVPDDCITSLVECRADIAAGCYVYLRHEDGATLPVLSVRCEGEWRREWFDGTHEADAAGTGCMLVARETFEAVGFPWFRWPQWLDDDGRIHQQSDDFDFCAAAINAGRRIVADGAVRCRHFHEFDLGMLIPQGVTC